MDSDKPAGQAVQVLGRNMGAIPSVNERIDESSPPAAFVAAVNRETAAVLERVMRDVLRLHEQREQADVVDGEMIDMRNENERDGA
jgi:hypothetical protein